MQPRFLKGLSFCGVCQRFACFDESCGQFVDISVQRIAELFFQDNPVSQKPEEHDSGGTQLVIHGGEAFYGFRTGSCEVGTVSAVPVGDGQVVHIQKTVIRLLFYIGHS